MEIREPSRGANGDAESNTPLQRRLFRGFFRIKQEAGEGSVLHELVDKKPVTTLRAETYQLHQIQMVRATDHPHNLHHKMFLTMLNTLQSLDCNTLVAERTSIHSPTSSFTELIRESLG
uniref:Uncharacterized protein n=1 Tax=Kalanchoe fedtschenkoi TaxID=63787 RepID=A0A7N0UA47_KALFE